VEYDKDYALGVYTAAFNRDKGRINHFEIWLEPICRNSTPRNAVVVGEIDMVVMHFEFETNMSCYLVEL
jgi:hypothetical protein